MQSPQQSRGRFKLEEHAGSRPQSQRHQQQIYTEIKNLEAPKSELTNDHKQEKLSDSSSEVSIDWDVYARGEKAWKRRT